MIWRSGLVRLAGTVAFAATLAACGQQNTYQAPPPPKVTVSPPVSQKVTRYFEATGNAAAVNSANLVARVQGFLTEIKYQDGMPVKKGDHLFTIEPEPYQLKFAAGAGGRAGRAGDRGADAGRLRSPAGNWCSGKLRRKAAFDKCDREPRQREGQVCCRRRLTPSRHRSISDYTKVVAPFDGIVTARRVSTGELVGGSQGRPDPRHHRRNSIRST